MVPALLGRLWLIPLLAVLSACGTLEVGLESAQSEVNATAIASQAAMDAAATPVVQGADAVGTFEITEAAQTSGTPTTVTREALLPAPVYYINEADGQIWRVEVDGVSIKQITAESAPVTDFDVSPKDGALAYVSGNQLIYASPALGDRRQLLIPGSADYDESDYLSVVTLGISRPRWSPDGRWIAFGEGGVSVFLDPAAPRVEEMPEVQMVLANDPLPDPLPAEGDIYEGPQRRFEPLGWLPDGQQLMVQGAYTFALGSFNGILNVADGSLIELEETRGTPCCDQVLGQLSGQLYYAGSQPGMFQTGLIRLAPLTGQITTLIPGQQAGEYHLFSQPFEVDSGRVYGFYSSEAAAENVMPFPSRPLVMVSVAGDGSAELELLRQDYLVVGEADWLPDGSGAVISDVAGRQESWPRSGVLRWLASDGRPALTLPALGRLPQWGHGFNG